MKHEAIDPERCRDLERALHHMAHDLLMCRSDLAAQRNLGGKRAVYSGINLRALPAAVKKLCGTI
jgi:hypothetical protein